MKSIWKNFLVASIMACMLSPMSFAGSEEHDLLKQTATKKWQAMVNADWGTVFDILSPYDRERLVQREQFIEFKKTRGPFYFTSADVGEVAVDGAIGWVLVKWTAGIVEFPDYPPKNVAKWEIWAKKGDRWYPVPSAESAHIPRMPPHVRENKEQAALKQRVTDYWAAKKEDDWARVYDFIEPAYKEDFSRETFLKRKSLYRYIDVKPDWVEALGEKGRARVSFTFKYKDPGVAKLAPESKAIVEEWVKVDGQWYRRMARAGDSNAI